MNLHDTLPALPAFGSFGIGFALCASLIVAIGAQNAFVLRQALRREHVGPIVALCIALDVVLMAAGVFGLARLSAPSPLLLQGLVIAGAAFLLVYGWSAAKRAWSPSALDVDGSGGSRTLGRVLGQTLALTLLNPHVYVDTVMLVGAVGAQQPAGQHGLFVAGAGTASALWFLLLGYGARWLSPWFARPAAWRWLDGVVAATMWSLAGLMLWGLLVGGSAVAAILPGLAPRP